MIVVMVMVRVWYWSWFHKIICNGNQLNLLGIATQENMMFIELVTRFFRLFLVTHHHSSSLMNKVSVECPRIQSSSSFWIRWHVAKRSCHSLETQEILSQSGKYGNSMKCPLCELHNSSKHMMKTCVAHPVSSCYEHLACLLRRWQILASPFLPQNYLCEEQFVPLKSID